MCLGGDMADDCGNGKRKRECEAPGADWESYGGVVWAARKERGLSLPFLADLALTTPELLQGVALPAEESLHRIAELATRLTLHPRQELTGP